MNEVPPVAQCPPEHLGLAAWLMDSFVIFSMSFFFYANPNFVLFSTASRGLNEGAANPGPSCSKAIALPGSCRALCVYKKDSSFKR